MNWQTIVPGDLENGLWWPLHGPGCATRSSTDQGPAVGTRGRRRARLVVDCDRVVQRAARPRLGFCCIAVSSSESASSGSSNCPATTRISRRRWDHLAAARCTPGCRSIVSPPRTGTGPPGPQRKSLRAGLKLCGYGRNRRSGRRRAGMAGRCQDRRHRHMKNWCNRPGFAWASLLSIRGLRMTPARLERAASGGGGGASQETERCVLLRRGPGFDRMVADGSLNQWAGPARSVPRRALSALLCSRLHRSSCMVYSTRFPADALNSTVSTAPRAARSRQLFVRGSDEWMPVAQDRNKRVTDSLEALLARAG